MGKQIAIDGPAGAGKSTIAKLLSKEKGFIYVDTGAMYRAIALFLLEKGVDVDDEEAVKNVLSEADVRLQFIDGKQCVLLNEKDVTDCLRTEEVGNTASKVSAYPPVRECLAGLQRRTAEVNDVVMDGRDIGTVILPNAPLKVFLTASVSVRAKRRFLELSEKGEECDIKKIEADIRERDKRDMTRETAPLVKAEDAVLLDSSDMSIDEVVSRLQELCRERGL